MISVQNLVSFSPV